jgi:5'-3' exonuclease
MATVVLIDLSSIAYPIWCMSQSNPDANACSRAVVDRVRALANGQPHVAICCDSGRSFRHDLEPGYKAQRPEQDGTLRHQITLACEAFRADGYPVWSAKGFEADDVIASATAWALEREDVDVVIVSADKDLLQLVDERVTAKSATRGDVLGPEEVAAKFGVSPGQFADYLALCGDTADNVRGAKGIGPKTAADLLSRFGSLAGIYAAIDAGPVSAGFKPSVLAALKEFRGRAADTRTLVTLRTDVELPFADVLADRVEQPPPPMAEMADYDEEESDMDETTYPQAETVAPQAETAPPPAETPTPSPATVHPIATAPSAIAIREADVLPAAPVEWERQLDPRTLKQAQALAQDMFTARTFTGYGNPQAVLSTILVGRELGIPAMSSLRSIHIIDGRHSLSAQLIVALVLRSGFADYFRPVDVSETSATYVTKRKGDDPFTLTHTIEMAARAGLVKDGSGWKKNPTDMLVARCSARLARLIYPDVCANVYTPEELEDIRRGEAA